MKKLLLTFLVSTLFTTAAMANTILTSTIQGENRTLVLKLQLTGNKDVRALLLTEKGTSPVRKTVAQARSSKGAVLFSKKNKNKNYDILVLKVGSSFKIHDGGPVKLNYMYNGMTRSYRSYNLNLKRTGDKWSLYFNGRKVTRANVKKRKILGKEAGVKSISFR